jgi:hypothetical protein
LDVEYVVDSLPADDSIERFKDHARTRNTLAIILAIAFSMAILMAIAGGLLEVFTETTVITLVLALVAPAGAVTYFYFRRSAA